VPRSIRGRIPWANNARKSTGAEEAALATSIPQPAPPNPAVGEFNIHTRIEGIDLEAPEMPANSRRMRMTLRGAYDAEELLTRFVSKARLAGGIAVSDLSIDAMIAKNRNLYRCKANVAAQREERLVEQSKTLPAYTETHRKTVLIFGQEDAWAFPTRAVITEHVELPEEVVFYKQWDHGLRIELSSSKCERVTDLADDTPSVVRGRVYFPE
jgi:hypothetical protein